MSLRKVLVITAFDRPSYFRQTMDTWRNVRRFYDWDVVVRLEPSLFEVEHRATIDELEHPNLKIVVNETPLGVLHHPWVAFEELFRGYDFVVRAEDDLVVADDILEYFEWAAEEYRDDEEIAAVVGFSGRNADWADTVGSVERTPYFSPWVWGTWWDRWDEYISPTWDHNYSTYNEFPGNQSGWDWNLNTRVLPSRNKKCLYPAKSRVDNIGVYGVHGTPDNHQTANWFDYHNDPVEYVER